MKVTGEGFKNAVIGVGVLAGLGVLIYFGDKLVGLFGGVSDAAGNLSNDIAGAFVPDANVAVQSNVQQALAALKAAGSPLPGTQEYNDIVAKFGIAGAPLSTPAG